MRRFVERIAIDHAQAPRPIICALVNPAREADFAACPAFTRLPLGGAAVTAALFSPYGIALYATPEALAPPD